jgi:hypothetical protein
MEGWAKLAEEMLITASYYPDQYAPFALRSTQERRQKLNVGDKATEWFKSIAVCEVNGMRDA